MKAFHETVETNARLHMYIEGLLANIIDKYPELLEKRWAGCLQSLNSNNNYVNFIISELLFVFHRLFLYTMKQ